MSVAGKVAVITGSTSGIGLGIAQGFARAGINVMINGLGDTKVIEAILEELNGYGIKAQYHGADMTQSAQIRDLMSTTLESFGALDILVNNAGIQKVSPIDEFPEDSWDAIMAINLSSSFHTTKAAIPIMRSAGWGRIINIASAHGLVASPFKSAYVAAKHGVIGLTKTTALECAEQNITCNAICPGYVMTPLVEKQVTDTAIARGISEEQVKTDVMLKAQWTKKFVEVEELAGTALFLCSDSAQNITGTNISVDGGWTAA
ncbi:MAG: 3-hydroxybutyrate dehydrogenase [Pseudomonadales bacterium]|nr:3-hydroxybutyrate dehydrogenase [Pseudomonadales bacterium]NRA15136.1 3-hydroxybutyrate dehydrogenase [Oceanospirillaceae bacterium]